MQTADRTLAQRYARAIFQYACARGEEEAVAADLAACGRALAEAAPLLGDPRVPAPEKRSLVRASLSGASPLTVDFLDLLIDKKRFLLLPQVGRDFEGLLLQKRRTVRARVRAARPLAAADRARLRERLERFAGCGVELDVSEDPSLLGGVSVRLGDWVLDSSLSAGLARLKETIGGN